MDEPEVPRLPQAAGQATALVVAARAQEAAANALPHTPHKRVHDARRQALATPGAKPRAAGNDPQLPAAQRPAQPLHFRGPPQRAPGPLPSQARSNSLQKVRRDSRTGRVQLRQGGPEAQRRGGPPPAIHATAGRGPP